MKIEHKYAPKLIIEGEYLNGELNGKGKEYILNNYLFEGEILSGFKYGKGKVYLFGELFFEGEFLYGNIRRGKEYNNGRLEYEGEFLFNRKWSGKGYDENGKVIYELINGSGTVKEYSIKNRKIKFEGEYLNGKKNGICKEYDEGLLVFEGEYLNGKKNGIC